jgi:predicted homoserine dehydrogenase-like protein
MNYETLLAAAGDRIVRVGLVGVGDFGASLLVQAQKIPNLDVVMLCDTDSSRIDAAISAAGVDPATITSVSSFNDAEDVAIDVLVEATGNPVAAAEIGRHAISRGQHLVMASKEAAIVVGPMLQKLAAEKGLVYSEVEGDQPSLLIGLVSWAKTLGLNVRAAGKSSEYDFVLEEDCLNWLDKSAPNSGLQDFWLPKGKSWPDLVAARQACAEKIGVPTRTVPDFCEMGVVSNATGLMPDVPVLHTPILRSTELADALQLVEDGGLFSGHGRIEVFNCLRRPDELSFAGGVFVIVACEDEKTWELLRVKGHVVAANGKAAMLFNPKHLLGIEAPITILCAALLGIATGAMSPKPVVDLIARTTQDFKKGDVLSITNQHHHEVGGLVPELIPAVALTKDQPCPYYLAVGQTLLEDAPSGTVLTCGMLAIDQSIALVELRKQQDQAFGLG